MKFTDEALRRIANAVRRVERMPSVDTAWDEGSAKPFATRCCGKLDADLDCNNAAATATCSIWSYASGSWADTGVNITVRPPFAKPLGKILSGMKVDVEYHAAAGGWVVVAGGKARSIEFIVTADFDEDDASFSADVIDFRDGEDPDPADAGLSIVNPGPSPSGPYRFRGADTATGTALYDPETDSYYAIQMDCPAPQT